MFGPPCKVPKILILTKVKTNFFVLVMATFHRQQQQKKEKAGKKTMLHFLVTSIKEVVSWVVVHLFACFHN